MTARADLELARRHPTATVATLALVLAVGATAGRVDDGGWWTAAAVLAVVCAAGWLAVLFAVCRNHNRRQEEGAA